MERPYQLSCHCGNVRLEVDHDLDDLLQCNCSTCRRFGAIHWYVPAAAVKMVEQSRGLSTYAWQSLHEGHHFCGTCGASVFRSGYPDGVIAVNAALIDEVDTFALPDVKRWDGRTKMEPGVVR